MVDRRDGLLLCQSLIPDDLLYLILCNKRDRVLVGHCGGKQASNEETSLSYLHDLANCPTSSLERTKLPFLDDSRALLDLE